MSGLSGTATAGHLSALDHGWFSGDLSLLLRTCVMLGRHLNGCGDAGMGHSGLVACDRPQKRQHQSFMTTNHHLQLIKRPPNQSARSLLIATLAKYFNSIIT